MQPIRSDATLAEKCKPTTLEDTHFDARTQKLLRDVLSLGTCGLVINGPPGSGKSMLADVISSEHRRLRVSCVTEQTCGFYRQHVPCFCSTVAPDQRESWVIFDDVDDAPENVQYIICSYLDMFMGRTRFVATCVDFNTLVPELQSRFEAVSISAPSQEQMFLIAQRAWVQGGGTLLDAEIVADLTRCSEGSIAQLINALNKLLILGTDMPPARIGSHSAVLDEVVCDNYLQHCKQRSIELAIKSIIDLYDDGFTGYDIMASLQKTLLNGSSDIAGWALPLCAATIGVQARQDDITELLFFTAELINSAGAPQKI